MRAKMEAQRDRIGSAVPYTTVNGRHDDKMEKDLYWWTNGFWPGMLWLMYDDTKDTQYRAAAEKIELKFDGALSGYEGLHHDLGFMWTLTSRLNYKLTGNPYSRTRALHAANLLAGRYNPRGHFICAWNGNRPGWIIIDCMMNIPLLYWASREIEDPRYKYVAIEHANTALKYLVRPDGSCNHIAVLDPNTGELVETLAGQGYTAGSAWSRGQSWGLYGFALSYVHTGDERYLEASTRIARYVLDALGRTAFIPPVDYSAPEEPVKIDTSAGTIAAAGLLTLAGLEKNAESDFWREGAMSILKAVEAAHVDWDPDTDFLVKMGTAQYHGKTEELHVPLIYGDYYFLESVYRLRCGARQECLAPEIW
jgi:unsaturated chondroitin disaccharide hydrolase